MKNPRVAKIINEMIYDMHGYGAPELRKNIAEELYAAGWRKVGASKKEVDKKENNNAER